MKKFKIIGVIYTICLLISTVSVHANNLYLIESIDKNNRIFNLENEQGYITNEIVNINDNEVNFRLSINNKKLNQEIKEPGTEIMIVIDNSASMSWETSDGSIRKTILLDSVTSLVDKIYENSKDTKIGIVRFAGIWDDEYDCDDTDGYCKEGITGIQDVNQTGSVLMQNLTNNRTDVINAVNSIRNLNTIFLEDTELSTNIALGLKTAKDNFTTINNTKIIVLLSDGVPTQYFNKSVTTGWMSTYTYDDATRDTKNYLLSLDSNYNIISLMTGVTDEEDLEYVESIFGTKENPTTGKFYNIEDSDIEQIVENNIFNDLSEYISNSINNLNIKLNLTKEINENFNLTYDKATGFLCNDENYNINEIVGNGTAVLNYKITLKNNFNESIYDKITPIFDSIDINYSDSENNNHTLKITDSPTIRIVKLPKTGVNNSKILFSILMIISISSVFYLNKVNRLKNI